MKKFILIFFILLGVCVSNFAFANEMQVDGGKKIKVAISNNDYNSIEHKEITVSATSDWQIYDLKQEKVLGKPKANQELKIIIKHGFFDIYADEKELTYMLSGPLIISVKDGGFIKLTDIKRKNKESLYRGQIIIDKVKTKIDKFYVINEINLEEYLYGVVPNEMPVRFGLEALKAQAVAARNYVLRPRSRAQSEQYDVTDSVSSQVYFGANTEEELATRAVDETENIIATYDNEPILALYHSTSGGITENYENAFNRAGTKIFPANPLPYLKAVKDNEEHNFLEVEDDAIHYYKSCPSTFENNSPYFRWSRTWDKKELEEILTKTLNKYMNSGFVSQMMPFVTRVDDLKELKVLKRGLSGKIVKLSIVDANNVFFAERELIIRQLLLKDNKILPSANVVFEHNLDENGNLISITAHGGGYGHGVGMSQYGAGNLAQCGKNYSYILKHYYTDIDLTTIPIIVNTNEKSIKTQSFYFNHKKARLIVENMKPLNNINLWINGGESIKLKYSNTNQQILVYELTPYLQAGKNTIQIQNVEESYLNNEIKVYVEFLDEEE